MKPLTVRAVAIKGTGSKAMSGHCWRRIDFTLPESFGGGDMRDLGGVLAFWPGLFRPSGTFAIGVEADFLGERPPCGHHLSGTHVAEDAPCVLRDGNHHPMRRLGDSVGDRGEGECLIAGVALDAAQDRKS